MAYTTGQHVYNIRSSESVMLRHWEKEHTSLENAWQTWALPAQKRMCTRYRTVFPCPSVHVGIPWCSVSQGDIFRISYGTPRFSDGTPVCHKAWVEKPCLRVALTLVRPCSPPMVSSILSTLETSAGYWTHTSLVSTMCTVDELPGHDAHT